MKHLLMFLLFLFVAGCEPVPTCTRTIVEIGQCTTDTMLVRSQCAVRLEDGQIVKTYGPVIEGQRINLVGYRCTLKE